MDTAILATTFDSYPTLLKRFQSNFIDRIITYSLIGFFFSWAMDANNESWALKIMAIVVGLSYEPLMVAFFSRTVGQRVMGIKVMSFSIDQKISLLNAYAGFGIRLTLGWISFLSIHSNSERRALHDMASNTVVVMG